MGAWDRDAEWIILASCSILAIDLPAVGGEEINSEAYRHERTVNGVPEWGKLWAETLLNTSGRAAHGIMGNRGGSRGKPWDSDIARLFARKLKEGKTMCDAWIAANNAYPIAKEETEGGTHYYSPQNAVALMHTENMSDTLKVTTADSKSNEFSYTYIQWVYDPDRTTKVKYVPSPTNSIATKIFTVIMP